MEKSDLQVFAEIKALHANVLAEKICNILHEKHRLWPDGKKFFTKGDIPEDVFIEIYECVKLYISDTFREYIVKNMMCDYRIYEKYTDGKQVFTFFEFKKDFTFFEFKKQMFERLDEQIYRYVKLYFYEPDFPTKLVMIIYSNRMPGGCYEIVRTFYAKSSIYNFLNNCGYIRI